MASEKFLVCTSDSRIMVFDLNYNNAAEKARKTHQFRNFIESRTYDDFIRASHNSYREGSTELDIFRSYDDQSSNFLLKEVQLPEVDRRPNAFHNELETNNFPQNIASMPNTVHFDCRVPSSEIPEMIKNIGCVIEPEDKVFDVVFNPTTNQYSVPNFSPTKATAQGRKITYVRNHFRLQPNDYRELSQMISDFERHRRTNPALDVYDYEAQNITDNRKKSLFHIYADEFSMVEHRNLSILHEMKHIKNDVLLKGAGLKNDSRRMSIDDEYRVLVEDERSAYLSQAINAINTYLRKGNLNDFTMFDNETQWVANSLKRMPEGDRSAFVQNMPVIMQGSFTEFENNHRRAYDDGQFRNNLRLEVSQNMPVSAPEDTNRHEFLRRRSLLYHYQIYNPATGQMENKNLSSFITSDMEVKIPADVRRLTIDPLQPILRQRLNEYQQDVARGVISPAVIAEAKAMYRDRLHQPRTVSNIDGFEISNLYTDENDNRNNRPNDNGGNNQPNDNGGNNQPNDNTGGSTPTPVSHVPDDRASWSDKLENYWKTVEGYQKVAKNNNEYTFKVNNDTVSYTARNKVSVNSDAEYNTYVKLLQEPSNKNSKVRFKDTLSDEQKLLLYVACINNGREPVGNIPTDLSRVASMQNIPETERRLFAQQMEARNSTPADRTNQPPQRLPAAAQHTVPLSRLKGRQGGR